VRLWLFDFEHINAVDVLTDATGRYCTNVGIRMCVPWGQDARCQYTENTLFYHVSAPSSPTASSLENPIPPQCVAQSGAYSYAQYNTVQFFNDCAIVSDRDTNQLGNTEPLVAPLSTSISACNYCTGQGPGFCNVAGAQLSNACAQLPDVTLEPGGPQACAKLLALGEACTLETAPCCPTGTVCDDYVCVPSVGPKP